MFTNGKIVDNSEKNIACHKARNIFEILSIGSHLCAYLLSYSPLYQLISLARSLQEKWNYAQYSHRSLVGSVLATYVDARPQVKHIEQNEIKKNVLHRSQ